MVESKPSNDDIVDLAKRLKTLGVTEYSDGKVFLKFDLSYKDRIRTKKDLTTQESKSYFSEHFVDRSGSSIEDALKAMSNLATQSIRSPVQFVDKRSPQEREVDDTLYYSAV